MEFFLRIFVKKIYSFFLSIEEFTDEKKVTGRLILIDHHQMKLDKEFICAI